MTEARIIKIGGEIAKLLCTAGRDDFKCIERALRLIQPDRMTDARRDALRELRTMIEDLICEPNGVLSE